MKDLEKIKSEDLAAQVQDANPANFAIEQEVAQLVGATVPQPTQPSADDARELGAQLLVFLRRALTPIQTALRTAVAAIYAHLDSRCTDYTPAGYASFTPTHHAYDPMGSTTRTLPNLLTALTAFSDRKISGADCPDGMPLARLLLSDSASSVTEIDDSTEGWTLDRNNLALLTALRKVTLRCATITAQTFLSNQSSIEEAYLLKVKNIIATVYGATWLRNIQLQEDVTIPELESVTNSTFGWLYFLCDISGMKKVRLPKFKSIYNDGIRFLSGCPDLEEIYIGPATNFSYSGSSDGNLFCGLPKLKKAVFENFPTIGYRVGAGGSGYSQVPAATNGIFKDSPDLIYLDLGYADHNVYLNYWSPTLDSSNLDQFLQNFKEHIALRLTANGSGLTLTLSQAVFSAVIEGSSPICDDIKGIIEDKGWKVQDTNNNIFPTT